MAKNIKEHVANEVIRYIENDDDVYVVINHYCDYDGYTVDCAIFKTKRQLSNSLLGIGWSSEMIDGFMKRGFLCSTHFTLEIMTRKVGSWGTMF